MTDTWTDPKCVTRLPHTETILRGEVFEALGAASACWDTLVGAGVFHSERACEIGEELVARILDLTALGEANLGCASTNDLVSEVAARVALSDLGDYRTVSE